MAAKVKSFLSSASEIIETAAGWALLAAGAYSILFVDITGGGSLWNSLRGIKGHSAERIPASYQVVKVDPRAKEGPSDQDRILTAFEEPATEPVKASVPAPDSTVRPADTLTDSPADPSAADKDWKRSIKGELRSFTVYGRGEQASVSATMAEVPAQTQQPILATANSPAVKGLTSGAAARPGTGTRVRAAATAAPDGVRNIR